MSELAVVDVQDVLHAPVVPVVPAAADVKILAIHVRELVQAVVAVLAKVDARPVVQSAVPVVAIRLVPGVAVLIAPVHAKMVVLHAQDATLVVILLAEEDVLVKVIQRVLLVILVPAVRVVIPVQAVPDAVVALPAVQVLVADAAVAMVVAVCVAVIVPANATETVSDVPVVALPAVVVMDVLAVQVVVRAAPVVTVIAHRGAVVLVRRLAAQIVMLPVLINVLVGQQHSKRKRRI